MISVMAGVVASAGIAGSIYNHRRITNGHSETTTNHNQQHAESEVWSDGKKTVNEYNGHPTTPQVVKNKTDDTFTQLYIWRY